MTDDNREEKRASREIMVTGVPPELKSEFKILCFQRQVSMSEVVVALLRVHVKTAAAEAAKEK